MILVVIPLMIIGGYFINGYWCLLMAIGGYSIDGYFISRYWWLNYHRLLMAIVL